MTRSEAVERFVNEAASHVGLKEEPPGSNRGKLIDEMNDLTGAPLGSPWCASFVSYCGEEALGSLYTLTRSADCDVLLSFGRRRRITHSTAERGDVFLRLSPSDPDDAVHTGIVTDATASGVRTVEGNTNNDGGREGCCCLARSRPYDGRLVFVRWADLLDDVPGADDTNSQTGWTVHIGEADPIDAFADQNMVFVPLREFLTALFGTDVKKLLGFDPDEGGATWTGKPIPSSVPKRIIKDRTFVGVRAAAVWMGLDVMPDAANKTVTVFRPAPSRPLDQ